jgi:hypothetical protein
MNEHPIAFSGEMVTAILDGRKTQTRRVIKNSPCTCGNPPGVSDCRLENIGANQWACSSFSYTGDFVACPYGKSGDRLWVRETLAADERGMYYFADETLVSVPADFNQNVKEKLPSIFMPRWASRITLEITDIRVERLQEISDDDAISEGYKDIRGDINYERGDARQWFSWKWEEINGKKYPWDSNPYVWVIEFTKI